jgi:AcrR family transcriptional regulator
MVRIDMSDNSGPRSGYSRPVTERADAARNRARVLAAAAELFREHGVATVSMDQVAAAAGVGKGTLFRRFGDKAGLAVALLDAQETALQAAILSGPPPLGPGAAPAARLVAFLGAYADFLDDNLDLVHMSETARPGARYAIGAYRLWHRHVAYLLGEAGATDADYLAHALLAPLAADQRMALRDEVDRERVKSGLARLARSVIEGGDAP